MCERPKSSELPLLYTFPSLSEEPKFGRRESKPKTDPLKTLWCCLCCLASVIFLMADQWSELLQFSDENQAVRVENS